MVQVSIVLRWLIVVSEICERKTSHHKVVQIFTCVDSFLGDYLLVFYFILVMLIGYEN